MIAALAIFSVSCSKSDKGADSANDSTKTEKAEAGKAETGDTKAQVIRLCNETAAAIKANPADMDKIMAEFNEKGEALTKDLTEEDYKAYMQDQEFVNAMNAVQQAAMEAAASKKSSETSLTEEVEEVEAPAVTEAPAL